jgi:hypothetical protein
MHTRCARFPVAGLGHRCSVLIRYRVPGARYPEPGTRYLAPVFEKPAHGVCIRIPVTGYPAPLYTYSPSQILKTYAVGRAFLRQGSTAIRP